MVNQNLLVTAAFVLTLSLVAAFSPVKDTACGPTHVTTFRANAFASQSENVATTYDATKDQTTVALAPMQIWTGRGKYVSLYLSPSFKFAGRRQLAAPAYIDFEVRTVVRRRLSTDLYVIFLIDGEKVFLSSNRWAIKRPVPGRVWVGERLVFRMPYETFVKITKAKTFAIKLDATTFEVGEKEKQLLGDFLSYIKTSE